MEQDSHVGDPHGALDIVEMMNAVVREQNEYGSWAAKEICDRYSLLSTKCSDLQAALDAKDARIRELEQERTTAEHDLEEYQQYAMNEVRKACQEAGIPVAEDDSISIGKASDIAKKVKLLQRDLDAVLPDAVWAMQHVHHDFMPGTAEWHRAAAFLTCDIIKDYLARHGQSGEKEQEHE